VKRGHGARFDQGRRTKGGGAFIIEDLRFAQDGGRKAIGLATRRSATPGHQGRFW